MYRLTELLLLFVVGGSDTFHISSALFEKSEMAFTETCQFFDTIGNRIF